MRKKLATLTPSRCAFRLAAVLGLCFSVAAHGGDILRGGAPAGSPGRGAGRGGGMNAGMDRARMNAKDSLARTSQALQSMKAMQDAARAAAIKGPNRLGANLPNVTNGLSPGGLKVAAGVPVDLANPQPGENAALWNGAKLPTQKVQNGHTTVTVEQMKQQALLTWEKFNIGKETTLHFDQRRGGKDAGKWIAFNKIEDPSGVPSQILGSIKAQGQVYVINQNGIIFGGSSQINVHGLVASSLPINDNLLSLGLLNNPDEQFLFSALPIPVLSTGAKMPAFTPPPPPNTPNGKQGDVIVQPGARLTAPTNADHVGGRIALVGPNVKNAGTISTPDGQTILAAGRQVGFRAHASSDATLRGLDVFVGQVDADSGTATNAGLINIERANATITGKNVNQFGAIDSSTSVDLNGRIDLKANYGSTVTLGNNNKPFLSPKLTGTVTLGANSMMRILPELTNEDTVVGTQLALNSQINLQGLGIYLGANAAVFAPSAAVTLRAGTFQPNSQGDALFTFNKGQIYFDAGAFINVAGSFDVPASITQNILTLEMRGAELADSPLQRGGPLRGPTLFLDIRKTGTFNGFSWVGTPLGDASGYVGLVQRTVAQLTVTGGSVKMNAGESVIMQPGSVIDVSGGWTNFDGGMVQTTRVLARGRLIDISQATPNRIYDGIYTGTFTSTHSRWGIENTYQHPLALTGAHYESDYTQGANAGSVEVVAPSVALDGTLRGHTVSGERQRAAEPLSALLSISFQAQDATKPGLPLHSPTPPSVIFSSTSVLNPVAPFALDVNGEPVPLRADRKANVVLAPELLSEQGFGQFALDNRDGNITVPAGVTLNVAPGGSIKLDGANVTIAGVLSAPAGTLSLGAYNISPFTAAEIAASNNRVTPPPNADRGIITLSPGALLSTAGLIVDDRPLAEERNQLPLLINGGTISLTSYTANLAEGSIIDASGGVALNAAGRATYGSGGSISIKAGQDPTLGAVLGGKLTLGSELRAFSGGKGGSLAITAPVIQIGGVLAREGTLLLSPEFFNTGGFTSFSLTGLGAATAQADEFIPGITIASGTVIDPEVQSWLAVPHTTGYDGVTLRPIVRPEGVRPPVSLSFNTPGVRDSFNSSLLLRGDFLLGAGALIEAGPLGSVTVRGDTVTVLGGIAAPGGSITIAGGNTFAANTPPNNPLATVFLGPQSVLTTAGTTVLVPDLRGFRSGVVLPGGSISVSGNLVASAGAILDVSGTSGVLDVHPSFLGLTASLDGTLEGQVSGIPLVPTTSGLTTPLYNFGLAVSSRRDSDAGSITLAGGQMLFTDATLLGSAGGPTALGGKLSISSGKFIPPGNNTPQNPLDVTLVVTQNGLTIPKPITGIGQSVLDANNAVVPGRGYFAVDRFHAGGFDALTLGGTVQFSGPIRIDAMRSLTIATSGVIFADAKVELTAPYVALGKPFLPPALSGQAPPPFIDGNNQPFFFSPTHGPGSLVVHAQLIDIGNLSLQNIGRASFFADSGDIRGNGTLDVAGDIFMRAAQIYPPTAVSFTIAASDYLDNGGITVPGKVTIVGSGNRRLPMSAGGTLNIYGSIIEQGGTLRAPLGVINIGWDGTGTAPKGAVTGQSVASTEQLTLGQGSITSISAIDPGTGTGLIIPYGLDLNGVSWIDPAGFDITAIGAPGKKVNLSAVSIDSQAGSLIDVRGGGDLFAYQWLKGVGGSRDILASTTSFAVIPGYQASYMPYAPFNSSPLATNLGGNPGYVNGSLSVGDQIYLGRSDGLAAGVYTLLPARYALLPGAFLVTAQSGTPIGTFVNPDGSSIVSGYRLNSLNPAGLDGHLFSRFEVIRSGVVRERAEYADFLGNFTFPAYARRLGVAQNRLPGDSGQVVLQATQALTLQGSVSAAATGGGRGGLVDISSPVDILIAGPGAQGNGNQLVLDAANLSSFGAESLLVGGVRQGNGALTVKTGSITVDNAGAALIGPEIILAASQNLTLATNAVVKQGGSFSGKADTLTLTGDGVLLRVSGDASAQTIRTGITASPLPTMTIGAGAQIAGASVTLDSTSATSLDPTASIKGSTISLNSGRISIQLDNPGALQPNTGLVLSGNSLDGLRSAKVLSLLSYSSIDLYGTGTFDIDGRLELHSGGIRGFNNGGGNLTLGASEVLLDNRANVSALAPAAPSSGSLTFETDTLRIGVNQLRIDQYGSVFVNATDGIIGEGAGGLTVAGSLTTTAPIVTAARNSTQSITATGALTLLGGGAAQITGGLGASLTLQGASVTANTDILLPSGLLTLRATAGDVQVGGRLDVGGTARDFYDLVKFTDAGRLTLTSNTGSVHVLAGGTLNVAAATAGGDAGSLIINAANGNFTNAGTISGQAGQGGTGGNFALDTGSLANFAGLSASLTAGGFTQSQAFRVRTGDVLIDGVTAAHDFRLSADQGSITVSGIINASGTTGGTISLLAGNHLTLLNGASLTVAAQDFNHAGKGGAVSLESRAGTIDVQAGSAIDLTVASNTASSADFGKFTGTLHLRAAQNAAATDLQVNPVLGTINGASKITVEGFRVFDLTGSGLITAAVQASVFSNATTFTANTNAITTRLFGLNPGLTPLAVITPGAELVNTTGNLTLGSANDQSTSDWNLATFRFGPRNVAGVLTLRAAQNIVLFNSISDGFATSDYNSLLLAPNAQLPVNAQSWSYRFTAGADFASADFRSVVTGGGSLQLGKNAGQGISNSFPGGQAQTGNAIDPVGITPSRFQVIRTGSGDIDIHAGADVQLLNQFASIYTVGTRVADPTTLPGGGLFDLPILDITNGTNGALGQVQQNPEYPAQYTLAGGNVTISAGSDITHLTRVGGNLVADSQRAMPTNWLYRRSYIDPLTGQFGTARFGDAASTTWWIDYSNFFQGVGTLGGGNITMTAGRDVSNVDAVAPTNARMARGTPDASKLVELGGGDIVVRAGRDIDAGMYYVERGQGTLSAGGSIKTNSTRSPSLTIITGQAPMTSEAWLPTTLFLGKGSFDVSARGDLLLGPVANPFLLPGGVQNTFWYKTYFSTYAPTNAVEVASLGGDVTLRHSATLDRDKGSGNPLEGIRSDVPILQAWYENVLLLNQNNPSFYQPWLRLNETSVAPFATASSLLPSTLRTTAFSGDINLVGNLTLSPSPTGTIDLAAAGAINGLQVNGQTILSGVVTKTWGTSSINLSDANPAALPGITSALAYHTVAGNVTSIANTTGLTFLAQFDAFFAESGSTQGTQAVLQTKQALHAPGVLHAGDPNPVHLYALGGDIADLTLFSGKAARVIASRDITDIALYIQNVDADDITLVSAGRDIVAFNDNSPLRVTARSTGNTFNQGEVALAGDIQISGPGTLEVLAGRNLDLGVGPNNPDGTGVGIVSIGNARNPFLPFEGASVIGGAGLGSTATGLATSSLDFQRFFDEILTRDKLDTYLSELNVPGVTSANFNQLSDERKAQLALEMFYLVLRDAGRDTAYEEGFAAIDALFPNAGTGNISLTSRVVKTRSGGNVSLFAPGGALTVGFDVAGTQALDQGILTESGGNISIFTDQDVIVGTSRIFTLRGGDEIIWSSNGDIAAGASAKTVQSAPPTRVLIDPQSGDVQTDLAGLATGGGIGVLATVANVPPGDVDLIAPNGAIDAGDAGIRVSGNLNLAAPTVLNASNIAAAGSTSGTPASAPAAPAAPIAPVSPTAATNTSAQEQMAAQQQRTETAPVVDEAPSVISVEVIGYGGGDGADEDEEEKRRRQQTQAPL